MWDSEVSPEVERSRNYGTELNHRCGEVSSHSPLLCPPLAPHTIILLPCACYIGYTYRILHGKFGRTVFSYELLTFLQKSKGWDFWYKNSVPWNTVQSIFHVVLCLLDTETFVIDSAVLAFYFKSFWNAKFSKKWSLHTTKLTWQKQRRIFLVRTFSKNYNED